MIPSGATAMCDVELLQVELRSICAPEAFGQAGSADPLVYATLHLADGSYFHASEIFEDGNLIYGFLVRDQGKTGWNLLELGAEASKVVELSPHTPPKALRKLLTELHGITLQAPRFL